MKHLLTVTLLLAGALPLRAQEYVLTGRVVRHADSLPVAGASVRALRSGHAATSDAAGRFRISLTDDIDTLVTRMVGMRPDTLPVARGDTVRTIALRAAPVNLADLVSSGQAERPLASGSGGSWSVGAEAARVLPAAIEPDVNRMLTLVPAISFSSLLSGRPLIRGLDADDASFTINGFEAINLYHVGRIFSAFPALGADRVDLDLQPISASIGRSNSGRIGIVGRNSGSPRETSIQYGLGMWSAATGWSGPISGWAAARTVKGSLLGFGADKASQAAEEEGIDFHFGFQDGYLGLATDPARLPPIQLTLFASRDWLTARESGDYYQDEEDVGLDWDNMVLGVRSQVMRRTTLDLELFASTSRHAEVANPTFVRDGFGVVHNDFTRWSTGVDGTWRGITSPFSLHFGVEGGRRRIHNDVEMIEPGELPSVSHRGDAMEWALFGEATWQRGRNRLTAGVRVDGYGRLAEWQPRLGFRRTVGLEGWWSVAVGRATRLHHLVSDERTEPKFAYYDSWLTVGMPGVPPARMDHLAAEMGGRIGQTRLRAGLFAGSGRGILDFPPPGRKIADSTFPYRSGRVRVAGFDADMRVGNARGTRSLIASYAFTVSQRDWGGGWENWTNERRHQLRAAATLTPPFGTIFSMTLELASGTHFQPYAGFYPDHDPTETISGEYLHPLLGGETDGTGPLALRGDVSLTRPFDGLFGLQFEVGFSITNFTFGEVGPRRADFTPSLGIGSEPKYLIPMVPSLIFRVRPKP